VNIEQGISNVEVWYRLSLSINVSFGTVDLS